MRQGDHVRFKAHGLTGLTHKVVTVDEGGELTLQDPRGRLLRNVPGELVESTAKPGVKSTR